MTAFLTLFFISLILMGLGLWQLATSLDVLWQSHEKFLLAQGLSPQRNDVWERGARRGGWVCLIAGIVMLALSGLLSASISTSSPPPAMSGISINGRELTQAEWDACGRDAATCLTAEVIRGRR